MNSENNQNGFKMTEIGLLPEEWDVVRLQEAFNFTQKPKNVIIKNFDKIPFIPMENIPSEEIYATKIDLKNPAEIKTGTFFENGDLLVAKITPSFENGKQCIVENVENKFGYATTEVWPIKKTKRSDVLFLFFYLKKGDIRKYIAGKMEGSTGRQRVPKHVLSNLIIPLPPLPEQKKIAAVLSAVQEAREKTEAMIAAAQELKKSLMKYLFTYGPVPVAEADQVRLKETEIGVMPEEWEVKKIGSFAKFQGGYAFKSLDYQDQGVRLFKISNVSFGKTSWEDISYLPSNYLTEFREYELKPGDLVMAMTRPIVKGGIKISRLKKNDCPSLMNQRVGRFIPNEEINIEFLFQTLFNPSFVSSISAGSLGSQQPNISSKQIESIMIPLPPLNFQNIIANALSLLDQKIESEQSKKQALDQLFKSLLNNLMTGKIRVNHLEL